MAEKKAEKPKKKRAVRKPARPGKKAEPAPEAVAVPEIKEEVKAPTFAKAPAGKPAKPKKKGVTYYGTGRRKTSVAKVWLFPGEGKVLINERPLREYMGGRKLLEVTALEPLTLTKTMGQYDVLARVLGGGVAGQAGAIKHGLARALALVNSDLKKALRDAGHLTRDSRMKERKKYGHKRARKSFQYSKR